MAAGATSAGGEPAVIATGVDITARRDSEVRAREAEGVLRLATASGGVGTWTLHIARDELEIDASAARIVGGSRKEIRTMADFLARVHRADRAIIDPVSVQAPTGITCRFTDGTNVTRTALIRGSAFGSGEHARMAGTIVDISATHDLSHRLNETLESISDAYFAVDESWHVIYANRHAARLINDRAADVSGRTFWELFGAENSALETNLRHAMTSRTPVSMEGAYMPRGAWYEVRAFPLRKGLSIYFSDITDRKSVEQQRDRLLASEREARLRAEEARHHIAFQARHDALTGLVNRTELARGLESFMSNDGIHRAAVMFVDIDHFKWDNDSLGHPRSEEHTSELQSRGHLVCRLLLEKKKITNT